MDHKIEFVSSAWEPKDRRDDTVYITPSNYEYQPGVFKPLKRRVFGGADTPRPPGIPPQQWAVHGFWPPAIKDNAIKEWKEKKKYSAVGRPFRASKETPLSLAPLGALTGCLFTKRTLKPRPSSDVMR